jgi:glycosyltransferase involved in cell wall biosynthesis
MTITFKWLVADSMSGGSMTPPAIICNRLSTATDGRCPRLAMTQANARRSDAEDPQKVSLDIVTPTYARPREMIGLARTLAPQLSENDRWIVVDDASPDPLDLTSLSGEIGTAAEHQLLLVRLSYMRTADSVGTIQRARATGVSCTRPNAWIVEIDDHDWPEPNAIELIRQSIRAGALFVYGDVRWCDEEGRGNKIFRKPDYTPFLLRDHLCPAEGLRAYPRWLYDKVGGYRWSGPLGLHGCEFPAGDYALYTRMELALGGKGFVRIPTVLNRQPKVFDGISIVYSAQQQAMANKIREAARQGDLLR